MCNSYLQIPLNQQEMAVGFLNTKCLEYNMRKNLHLTSLPNIGKWKSPAV